MKKCSSCKQFKEIDGKGHRCLGCEQKRWNARKLNPEKNTQLRLRLFVDSLKKSPCLDCGHSYPPFVMDFDHRKSEEKFMNVSQMVVRKKSIDLIFNEILKCDLVCSNCHRIRTHNRRKSLI